MKRKKIYNFFALPDFLDEQEFLMKQHSIGWKFETFNGFSKYIFVECSPENYIYQLDYNEDKKDEDSYIQLFEDYGWEYLLKENNFYYFRKPFSDNIQDNTIFSNTESKLLMCRKVLTKQKRLFVVLLPILVIVTYFLIRDLNNMSLVWAITSILCIIIYLFSLLFHVRNFIKISTLINKYK